MLTFLRDSSGYIEAIIFFLLLLQSTSIFNSLWYAKLKKVISDCSIVKISLYTMPKSLHGKKMFEQNFNVLIVLKLFQLSNGDFTFF